VNGDGVRIGPVQLRQGGPDAGSSGLGNMDEEDFVAWRKKH
jgi:hypothetical protein